MLLGDAVAKQGWRTGAVISPEMVPFIKHYLTRPDAEAVNVADVDWLVVVSQTCDVVARKLELEPFIEVLHCRPIKKLRTEFCDLRSTRNLDFRPNRKSHELIVLTAHAVGDRYLIPRNLFADHSPDRDRHLSAVAQHRIMSWYALRASRPSWPDAFGNRIKDKINTLKAALEPLKDDIAEVRIAISPNDEELADDQAYKVVVYFVVDASTWDGDDEGRGTIFQAFLTFVSELNGCIGIDVDLDLSGVESGDKFTWQQTRSTDEWNFANLSHREE